MAQAERDTIGAEELQLVTFTILGRRLGVDITRVREIIREQEVTKVPQAPAFMEGVINLRGQVIPVIDMPRRFGLAGQAHTKSTRIVVLEIRDMVVGFVVDSVNEVMRIPANIVQETPSVISGAGSQFIQGIAQVNDRLLIVLEADSLLDEQELSQLEGIEDRRKGS